MKLAKLEQSPLKRRQMGHKLCMKAPEMQRMSCLQRLKINEIPILSRTMSETHSKKLRIRAEN